MLTRCLRSRVGGVFFRISSFLILTPSPQSIGASHGEFNLLWLLISAPQNISPPLPKNGTSHGKLWQCGDFAVYRKVTGHEILVPESLLPKTLFNVFLNILSLTSFGMSLFFNPFSSLTSHKLLSLTSLVKRPRNQQFQNITLWSEVHVYYYSKLFLIRTRLAFPNNLNSKLQNSSFVSFTEKCSKKASSFKIDSIRGGYSNKSPHTSYLHTSPIWQFTWGNG